VNATVFRRTAVTVLAMFAGMAASNDAWASSDEPVTVSTVDTSGITPARVGDLTLVEADRRGVVMENGGSAAQFSVDLPQGSTCPGDSENDNWRLQTFIVPASVDPGTLEYTGNGPTGFKQYAIYDVFTQAVADQLTVPNDGPGQPGRPTPFPPMSFRVFPPGEIPPGSYRIGVACTWFGATANYWDTEIVIAAEPKDEPAQLTWRLPSAPPAALSGTKPPSDFPWTTVFLSIAVVSLAAYILISRRAASASHSERTRS
jgi:hypothetical protein